MSDHDIPLTITALDALGAAMTLPKERGHRMPCGCQRCTGTNTATDYDAVTDHAAAILDRVTDMLQSEGFSVASVQAADHHFRAIQGLLVEDLRGE